MKKNFTIDARVILTLGKDSIKDHTTALVELVKNSYDADATKVWVDIGSKGNNKYISIIDNGGGMTEYDIENRWLRIGYSEKRTNKVSIKKRRKTGEKGIGRISADRLGASLTLTTKAKDSEIVGVVINWDDFNVEGKDLTSIPITTIEKPQMHGLMSRDHNNVGTELIINKLRQNWTKKDIEDLYNELSTLTPPFKHVEDFDIYLETDVDDEFNGKISSPFFQNAEIELNAEFDGKIIVYDIKDRKENKQKVKRKISWTELLQKDLGTITEQIGNKIIFGPVSFTLLFWAREAKSITDTNLRLSDLRDFLDKNAGVKIYRDNVRVKPYGNPNEPEGDWLGLAERKTREPAGVARPRWRVAANQVVGAVFVSRDKNSNLVDSSSREGLIHDDAFNQLRMFVLGCLRLLEIHRHELYKVRELTDKKVFSPSEDVKVLNKELIALKKDLSDVKKQLSTSSQKPIQRTIDQVVSVLDTIPETQKSINELISQSMVFRGLATIGIASAVFGHETQTSIAQFLSSTYTVRNILEKPSGKREIALSELSKSIKYAEQVASWGAFALSRIQRDKRRKKKLKIDKLISNIVNEVKAIFTAVDIELIESLENVECHTYAMDLEAIVLNLLTNAYTACQQISRKRSIRIKLNKQKVKTVDGYNISVSDTGPGINDDIKKMIWQPLFTTKVDRDGIEIGTGLGLTIINAIVNDLKGAKSVDVDPLLKGARFSIWFPLE